MDVTQYHKGPDLLFSQAVFGENMLLQILIAEGSMHSLINIIHRFLILSAREIYIIEPFIQSVNSSYQY